MARAKHGSSTLLLLVLSVALRACSDEPEDIGRPPDASSETAQDAGAATDLGPRDADSDPPDAGEADLGPPPFTEACDPSFGSPLAALDPSLSGQDVVVEGDLQTFSNPVGVAGRSCPDGTAGLIFVGEDASTRFVRLANTSGGFILCGCPEAEDAECASFPPGARVRLAGRYTYATTRVGVCIQPPCQVLEPSRACLLAACSTNEDCPSGRSCNRRLGQCRSGPGEDCSLAVGCASPPGARYTCSRDRCQAIGDGEEGAVCEAAGDCLCEDCACVLRTCRVIPP